MLSCVAYFLQKTCTSLLHIGCQFCSWPNEQPSMARPGQDSAHDTISTCAGPRAGAAAQAQHGNLLGVLCQPVATKRPAVSPSCSCRSVSLHPFPSFKFLKYFKYSKSKTHNDFKLKQHAKVKKIYIKHRTHMIIQKLSNINLSCLFCSH